LLASDVPAERPTELINYRDKPLLSKNVRALVSMASELRCIIFHQNEARSGAWNPGLRHPSEHLGRQSVAWNAITHRFARIRRLWIRFSAKSDNVLPPPRANLRKVFLSQFSLGAAVKPDHPLAPNRQTSLECSGLSSGIDTDKGAGLKQTAAAK
jgi:hypothetical protein